MELQQYKIPQEIKDEIKKLELAKIEIKFKECRGALSKSDCESYREITQELRKLYKEYKVEPILGDDIWAKKQGWQGYID